MPVGKVAVYYLPEKQQQRQKDVLYIHCEPSYIAMNQLQFEDSNFNANYPPAFR